MENYYLHPDAKIGKNVTIEPFSYIAGDVVIGDDTWIGPNVTIMDGARIGSGCKIFPGAVISAIPQDLKFHGEVTTAEIGNNTTIRECVTVNRGTEFGGGVTKIGSNTMLMAYVHVAHDCIIGNHCILANQASIAGHVVIDDYVIIEGGAVAVVVKVAGVSEYAIVNINAKIELPDTGEWLIDMMLKQLFGLP